MKLFFQDCKEKLTLDEVTSVDRQVTGYVQQMDHSQFVLKHCVLFGERVVLGQED
jgi:hypothetical protein